MASQCKKIEVLRVPLEPKTGTLHKVFGAFNEAKINVISSWAYEMGSKAEMVIWASDNSKAKDVLSKLGKQVQKGYACQAVGDDYVGVYDELLAKIAAKGINLTATDVISLNGKFCSTFFVKEQDIGSLCQALGC